jgi:hypothetical protein
MIGTGLMTVGVSPLAQAWVPWCGKFAGADPNITYKFFTSASAYVDAFNQAQYLWDVREVPGTFVTAAASDNDPMITVTSGSFAYGDWAKTYVPEPCSGQSVYVGNEVLVEMNTRTMSGLTASEKKYVMVHELGHAYGLWHQPMSCSQQPAIMEPGEEPFGCAGDPPWLDDREGVRAIY